jgi:Spy/CpxP family protein refolding chaperone
MSARKNIINTIIILLLAANVVTLGLIWFKRPPHPPASKSVVEFISTELNFDAQQKTALKKLFEEHEQATKTTRENIRQQKDAFFDLMKKENISDSLLEQESYKSVEAQRQMDIAVFNHFKQILALCNEEQKKKFDKVLQEALRVMKRPPQGPPPPDGERPEGPPPQ